MNGYVIKADKIVTVSERGTICNGAMLVRDGMIAAIDSWEKGENWAKNHRVIDWEGCVITPSLVDCHTHLLEYAPTSLFPVTAMTHTMGAVSVLLGALSSGITALGEQICGHPERDWSVEKYRAIVRGLPLDIRFSLSSITIGFDPPVHFTAATGSERVSRERLNDVSVLKHLAEQSEYPGENVFINATPANFREAVVPRAGEVIYSQRELNEIVAFYHRKGKKIGVHVAGEEAIDMALKAGVDVLHHAHGMTLSQIQRASAQGTMLVATPLGGTHLAPNSPKEVVMCVKNGLTVAVSTDAYLPPHEKASWLPFCDDSLKGPEVLMALAEPVMRMLIDEGWDENEALALITLNGAKVMDRHDRYGSLEEGKEANFLVASGVPGLEITAAEEIYAVYYRGEKVVERARQT